MEIVAKNACEAFLKTTEELLSRKKIYAFNLLYDVEPKSAQDELLERIYDEVFVGKTAWKGGKELGWREWLLNSGFPIMLYEENGKDLGKTIRDERISQRNFRARDSYHNFFGRMCRPLDSDSTYMNYMLDRWGSGAKSHPNFFFDIEPMEWVWEEMLRNKKQVKTGRAAATCATNMFFRWDTEEDRPIIGWVLKHSCWLHFYQDVFSPVLITEAINKELGKDWRWKANIFCVSLFLNEKPRALALLGKMRRINEEA